MKNVTSNSNFPLYATRCFMLFVCVSAASCFPKGGQPPALPNGYVVIVGAPDDCAIDLKRPRHDTTNMGKYGVVLGPHVDTVGVHQSFIFGRYGPRKASANQPVTVNAGYIIDTSKDTIELFSDFSAYEIAVNRLGASTTQEVESERYR